MFTLVKYLLSSPIKINVNCFLFIFLIHKEGETGDESRRFLFQSEQQDSRSPTDRSAVLLVSAREPEKESE